MIIFGGSWCKNDDVYESIEPILGSSAFDLARFRSTRETPVGNPANSILITVRALLKIRARDGIRLNRLVKGDFQSVINKIVRPTPSFSITFFLQRHFNLMSEIEPT